MKHGEPCGSGVLGPETWCQWCKRGVAPVEVARCRVRTCRNARAIRAAQEALDRGDIAAARKITRRPGPD